MSYVEEVLRYEPSTAQEVEAEAVTLYCRHKSCRSSTGNKGKPGELCATREDNGIHRSRFERGLASLKLKAILREGDKVGCVLRKVSNSGRSRQIDFISWRVSSTGEPKSRNSDGEWLYPLSKMHTCAHHLNSSISELLGYPRTENGALRVSGGGMDMGFSVVSSLSRALFGSDYSLQHFWV